ncbi:MAG TPA: ArsA family ATPase [Terriglobia bacterium]|nr:ArsA family ATPase [Terriglobia bacterium]
MAKLTFFVGKGGVGKTTISCAYALHLAARKPRTSVLLISTDPAHCLGDILQVRLKAAPGRVPGKGRLLAWQIDAAKEFRKFLSGNREAILRVVESGTLFTKEEIAPLLDTTLPGMAEVAGLLAIQKLMEEGKHDHIVVDTAPFGHTLRLFELPSHFQRFLNFLTVASRRDALLAERFGGYMRAPLPAFLDRWEAMVRQVSEAFSSKNAEIFLVTSPEAFSLNEAVRWLRSLKQDPLVPEMRLGAIVLNRVVMQPTYCPCCRRRARAAQQAEGFLKTAFPRVPVFRGPDPGNPVLGADLLRRFGLAVFGNRPAKLESNPLPQAKKELKFAEQPWPLARAPLSFILGKGGVGKTTTTAALAFHLRAAQSTLRVTVCSTDPAPSLGDIFAQPIGNEGSPVLGDPKFTAVEVDSVSEFRQWVARINRKLNSELSMQSGGVHVDFTFEKEVFAALLEVVPPGVDELFAVFRILELLKRPGGRVLIDMAPTGHALELLRMPERIQLWSRLLLKSLASHRTLALAQDVGVELASLAQEVRKLIAAMRDPEQSRVWVVMLPEPVPDHQTARLLQAVEKLGITVDSLFINRVLLPEKKDATCKRCSRGWAWQLATLHTIRSKYRRYPVFIAPEMPSEIVGAGGLKKFTSKLWRIEGPKSEFRSHEKLVSR